MEKALQMLVSPIIKCDSDDGKDSGRTNPTTDVLNYVHLLNENVTINTSSIKGFSPKDDG